MREIQRDNETERKERHHWALVESGIHAVAEVNLECNVCDEDTRQDTAMRQG